MKDAGSWPGDREILDTPRPGKASLQNTITFSAESNLRMVDRSPLRLLLRGTQDQDGQNASEEAEQLAGHWDRGCGDGGGHHGSIAVCAHVWPTCQRVWLL